MIRRLASISATLLVISGCAGLASTGTMSSSSPDEAVVADMAMLHRIESNFYVMDPSDLQIELKDLQAGQQVRLVTSASTVAEMKNGGNTRTTEYVGTIGAIDADNIVLKDASSLVTSAVMRGTPILSRVPYVSRMFRNSGVGRDVQPLPYGVTVPRSKVIMALEADSEFTKRIGVDFDYNADANESVLRDEVDFLIH